MNRGGKRRSFSRHSFLGVPQNTVPIKFPRNNNIGNRYVLFSVARRWRSNFALDAALVLEFEPHGYYRNPRTGGRLGFGHTGCIAPRFNVSIRILLHTAYQSEHTAEGKVDHAGNAPPSTSSRSPSHPRRSRGRLARPARRCHLHRGCRRRCRSERRPKQRHRPQLLAISCRVHRTGSKMQIVRCKCAGIVLQRVDCLRNHTYVRFYPLGNNVDDEDDDRPMMRTQHAARISPRIHGEFYPVVLKTRSRDARENVLLVPINVLSATVKREWEK